MSLPIYDREKRPMTVGSRFRYLHGTPYEQELELIESGGIASLQWPDGAQMTVKKFWYAPTDEPNSILITPA